MMARLARQARNLPNATEQSDSAEVSGRSGSDVVLEVEGLRKVYEGGKRDQSTVAIGDVTFEQREGEFLVLVGPSGCGKSTLLRCLAGLMPPTSGALRYEGTRVQGVPESLAVVFQEYGRSLYPWMTVKDNVALALHGLDRTEREDRISEALDHVDLADVPALYPWQLSGGMQQRVAIARAIASRPKLLLMDEPFASVDAQTRASLEAITLDLWREYGWTVLLVTHDIDEAVFMGDRVLVLSHRPSRIVESISIDLPRPRDQIETRALPEFQEYRRRIITLVRRHGEEGPGATPEGV